MNLVDAILATGWAMTPRVLEDLVSLAERHAAGVKVDQKDLAAIVEQRNQMFRDRMNVYIGLGARMPVAKTDPKSALEESPLAPPVVVDAVSQGKAPSYFLVDNVAVVPVQGVLAKHSSMVNGESQPVGMAYSFIARAVHNAAADPKADVILLDINSPGGMVAGVQDAYSEIEKVAQFKPVIAYAHDTAASAAYWLAAAADKIILSPTAVAGSIGVYTMHDDASGQLADRKIKRTLITSGPYKGAGAGNLPLNPDQLTAAQAEVGAMAQQFFLYVGKRRGLADAKLSAVTDGRVWIGPEAVQMGLADAVVTPREAIAYAQAFKGQRKRTAASPVKSAKGNQMEWNELTDAQIKDMPKSALDRIAGAHNLAAVKAEDKPATITELKSAFKDDATFALDCAEKNLTLAAAKGAYADVLATRLADATKKNETLEAKNTELAGKLGEKKPETAHGGPRQGSAGVDPVEQGNGGGAVGMDAVTERVKAIMENQKCSRATALHKLATGSAGDKALHKAWTDAKRPTLDV